MHTNVFTLSAYKIDDCLLSGLCPPVKGGTTAHLSPGSQGLGNRSVENRVSHYPCWCIAVSLKYMISRQKLSSIDIKLGNTRAFLASCYSRPGNKCSTAIGKCG